MQKLTSTPEHAAADEAALAFIARWTPSAGAERANFQPFYQELCALLGVPPPDPSVAGGGGYVFERAVRFPDGTSGFADLFKAECAVIEAKQMEHAAGGATTAEGPAGDKRRRRGSSVRRGTPGWEAKMRAAKEQGARYARSAEPERPAPPFVVAVDIGFCLDLHADFSGEGRTYAPFPDARRFRIRLADLADADTRETLRLVLTDPHTLDPSRRQAEVTRDVATGLAGLAAALEGAGHDSADVFGFLSRVLFTAFAEDAGLIPAGAFTAMLDSYRDRLDVLPDALEAVWRTMDTGGYAADFRARIPQFNGGLFHDPSALLLTEPQLDALLEAVRADWRQVEPAILGTLLERALDPAERHALGAHFTPRAYVERLVRPAVLDPLRAEWDAALAAATALYAAGKTAPARTEVERFLRRLTSVRVLDPAAGSGNFLYVALAGLKALEAEVVRALEAFGGQAGLGLEGVTVTPAQMLGIEVNPRAAAIADLVLWIGHLQWFMRTHAETERPPEPVLRDFGNVQCRDAVLAYDERRPRLGADGAPLTRWDGVTTKANPVTGEPVPNDDARVTIYEYANPLPAEWPAADFIVGNPPFLGGWTMRQALGDGYVEALWAAYPHVPQKADYVTYWWDRAADAVRAGTAERFGLITTNSIGQVFQRRVIQRHVEADVDPLRITFAVKDHPWVDGASAAAVRIAMTVGERAADRSAPAVLGRAVESGDEATVTSERVDRINADLSAGVDLDAARPLRANAGVASAGVQLYGAGFVVTDEDAERLAATVAPEVAARVLRPYMNGRDLMAQGRGARVIDFFGLTAEEAAESFPAAYQRVLDRVKPERDQNRREAIRRQWWRFGWERPVWRAASAGLSRFIATPETAKHRLFMFLDADVLPDNMVTAIALDDAFHLGVLSSRVHVAWALAAGGTLEDRPRYTKSRCFDPFPFPEAGEHAERVRALAERLDRHRQTVLAQGHGLTLTRLYNALESVRSGAALDAASRDVYDRGLVGVLRELHDDLDAAVAAAYGWPWPLPDDAVVERVVALNRERQAEEASGRVRWLRPDLAGQTTDGAQGTLAVGDVAPVAPAERRPWPKALADQVQAVQRAVAGADAPLRVDDIVAAYSGARRPTVVAVLDTLAALGLVRAIDGRYGA